MKLPFKYKRLAKQEFIAAAEWYEQRQHGLGDRFIEAIQSLIERICEQPTLFAIVRADVRQATERTFPYSVLYRIRNKQVIVLAVFHSSRDPKIWHDRI